MIEKSFTACDFRFPFDNGRIDSPAIAMYPAARNTISFRNLGSASQDTSLLSRTFCLKESVSLQSRSCVPRSASPGYL